MSAEPDEGEALSRLEEAIARALLGEQPLSDLAQQLGIQPMALLRMAARYSEGGRAALTK